MPEKPHRRAVAIAVLLLTGLAGCRSADGRAKITRIDRMMAEYPALHTGRFAIVADFEDEKHMELVTFRATTPSAKFTHDDRNGRPETGTGCLKITASHAEDTVIFSNRTTATWYLKRDWRAFDTMMMAIRTPRDGLSAHIAISSGTARTQATTAAIHRLRAGWNLLRLDLTEAAEQIAIDDVRKIRLSFSGLDQPTDLYVDDLILTADRAMIYGKDTVTGHAPFVQRIGKRLHIGTGGAFELTFAHGQIVSWFDLQADSHRLHNLVRGTTLGPLPVMLDESGQPSGDFIPPGRAVLAEQRLLEANAVRSVIECVWRFVNDAGAPVDDRPLLRRLYTIYPTGQVFVRVESTAATGTRPPPLVGLAIRMVPPNGDSVSASVPPTSGEEGLRHPTYGWLTAKGSHAGVLYVIEATDGETPLRPVRDESTGAVSLVGVDEKATGASRTWQCDLWLTTYDKNAAQSAKARASAFTDPPALDLMVGATPSNLGVTTLASGFDRGTGSYFLTADEGRVRFTLHPQTPHPVNPAFTVTDTADHEVWVYVNDILSKSTARNRHGDVIFQLRQPLRHTARVEVIIRRQ